MNYSFVWRIRIILGTILFLAVILGYRLYTLQITNHKKYERLAESQYSNISFSRFDRGSIFFESQTGSKVGVASIKEGYTVAVNPNIIENIEDSYNLLNSIIPVEKTDFLKKASKKGDPYEEIKKRVSEEDGDKINALKIPGLRAYKEYWRYYPNAKLASHVLGFVGYDSENNLTGRYGLERYYENVLKRNSFKASTNFFAEVFNLFEENGDEKQLASSSVKQSGDVITGIEPTVQGHLESELQSIVKKWNPEIVGALIIDPKTGQIYAMASMPEFDPNKYFEVSDISVFSNPIVENVYEMGSIMKPITLAIGLDAEVITPSSRYEDEGKLELNTETIYNFDKKARGDSSMQDILDKSLNVGAAHVALKTGSTKFKEYLENFGFDSLTGIDNPNEVRGKIKNLDSGRDIELATASYGQGISSTPIAMVTALSALANGGMVIKPHIASEIKYENGKTEKIEGSTNLRAISKETSEKITTMLIHVVDNALKNGDYKMDNWTIAAKTGTAQVAKINGRGYYSDRFLHSFFGYFPARNPRFLVFLFQKYPKGAEYASETLTEPFMNIAKFLINYYNLPPDR